MDQLENGRYTPEPTLFGERREARELELIPYGATELRITAFPDGVPRRQLEIYQALLGEAYPYDETKPLQAQAFPPETLRFEEFRTSAREIEADRRGYYNLLDFFPASERVLTYLLLRIWAPDDGRATFAVGASTGAEFFLNGERTFQIAPPFNAEFMMPLWFEGNVRAGYNQLMVKVVKGFKYFQYRNAWGVYALAFTPGR